MPLSRNCQSVITPTPTLPSALENNDHGRLAYTSRNSQILRPVAQSGIFPSSINSGHSVGRPPIPYESNSSSPSTTSSTLNSALTDNSPDSSPHSADSLHQTPFKQPRLNTDMISGASMEDIADDVSPVRPSTSASDSAALRKGRNQKGLSINTNGISARQIIDSRAAARGEAQRPVTQSGPAQTFRTGTLPPVSESAPVSPSFIIPKMPPRRKPSKLGLTIATPDNEQKTAVPQTPSLNGSFSVRQPIIPIQLQTIPQTPAFPPPSNLDRPADKSDGGNLMSPSLGPTGGMSFPAITGRELRTPGLAPIGGMTLPPFQNVDDSPSKSSSPGMEQYRPLQDHMGLYRHRSAENVADASSIVNQTIEHVNDAPNYDRPLSQEVKSPSYPEGPACIYPPNVYLYHQPTAAEARKFDVIINVAREVTNPFELEAEEEKARLHAKDAEPVRLPRPSYRSVGVQVDLLTDGKFDQASASTGRVAQTDETLDIDLAMDRLKISISDDAPQAQIKTESEPEYLHLPWEHNSKVYEEWFEICQLIDERTKKGKRVLIHCQLGVSRSASLIVAYGIYLNPRLSPDEAREQAKQRSRWIDINMHFMYELGDFKKLLARKGMTGAEAPRIGSMAGQVSKPPSLGLARSKTDTSLLSPTYSVPATSMSILSTIPGSAPLSGKEGHDGQFARVPESGLRTPGPSSAPADVTWSPSKRPKGMEDDVFATPIASEGMAVKLQDDEDFRIPTSLSVSAGQLSSGAKTPALDMPGGWAATPAMSRPTSMVLPEIGTTAADPKAAEDAGDQTPPSNSVLPQTLPADEDVGLDSKPSRASSFRRLPKMPSLPSGFTNSIGSFFSLNRSSSSASKKQQSPAPSRPVSISSRPQTRLDTIPGTPVDGPSASGEPLPALRKPPSLPTLRTFFPLGGNSEHKYGRPGLSLTLDPIPQSAVSGDQEAAASQDAALAALMSPRAQEFVHNPFNRPVTSHAMISSGTSNQNVQRSVGGFASMFSGFSQLSVKKQRSGQSLRSLTPEALNITAQGQTISSNANGTVPMLGRKASTGSHVTVVQQDTRDATLEDSNTRETMSPGTQARDPRSPPSVGVWGTEERILPSIDNVL